MPAFFFYGDDIYSLNQKLKFWKDEFEKKYGDLNTTLLDGDTCKAGEIIDNAQSMPFLADKRLVIVQNFLSGAETEQHESIGEFLPNVPDTTIIIFAEKKGVDKRLSLYKKLSKLAQPTEFAPLSPNQLVSWIQAEAAKIGGIIEADAARYLSEVVGGDLYRLANEVVKLVNASRKKSITRALIEKLVVNSLTTSIFKLTDALAQKNQSRALAELHTLIESGEELHAIFSMIARQFRILVSVKDLSDRGHKKDSIVAILKEHPFVISNTITQIRNFSMKQLRTAYDLLLDIDTRLKTGGIRITTGDNREFVLALDRLLVELCT